MTPLLLVTVAVVAGAVTTLGFAHAAGTSSRLVAPLLLLGLAAMPASGRELADRRRGELAVARLRGLHGRSLWLLLAVEPFLVLVLGALAGLLLGLLGARVAVGGWLTGPASSYTPALPEVALAAVLVGLVAVLVGAAGSLREPLGEQVRVAQRPRATSTLAIFVTLLVFAGAAVALYRAGSHGTAGDDPVVLAGPALVGLAFGQLAVWGLRLLSRWTTGRTSRSGLPTFLAVRRLARTPGFADPLRLLAAAGVVAALALNGTHAVDRFTSTGGRLAVGSAYQFHAPGRALDALTETHRLDPAGRHLMAAMLVADSPDASQRQAFVDSWRYAAVVAPTLRGTPAAAASAEVARLRTEAVPVLARGDSLAVSVTGVRGSLPADARARRVEVAVDYVDDANVTQTATVTMRLAPTATSGAGVAHLSSCRRSCSPVTFEVGQEIASPREQNTFTPEQADLDLNLTTLRLGDRDLLDETWSHRADMPTGFGGTVGGQGSLVQSRGAIAIHAAAGTQASFAPQALDRPLPVIATTGLSFSGPPSVQSVGGDERPAAVVAHAGALPFVAAGGTLSDLSAALVGSSPKVPAGHVLVLADASTPRSLLDTLRRLYGAPTTLAASTARIQRHVIAAQARVYVLMAGFCLLVALLVVAAWSGRQRVTQRWTVAGLRVVGVDPGAVRRAGWLELALLAATCVVACAVGAVVAVRGLLAHLPLVRPTAFAVPLDAAVAAWPLLVTAVVLVAGWWVLGARAVRVDAAPAVLREGADG